MVKDVESLTSYKQISKDQCFGCKLLSTPLFYVFTIYFSYKNFRTLQSERLTISRLDKFGLCLVPTLMFLGGTVNLYQAYNIFTVYQQEKKLLRVLQCQGIDVDTKTPEE